MPLRPENPGAARDVTTHYARIGIAGWWQKSDAIQPCAFAQLRLRAGDKAGEKSVLAPKRDAYLHRYAGRFAQHSHVFDVN
jgi:hypothetical protein